ncbi:MAG: family 43 glycosylhydrolase [Prevotella sp.]|nr:family 43 glycosylhydrolase [Prevotella sp.]
MNKILALVLTLMVGTSVQAQNPIIHDQFTADPTARVFNNRIYLFPSHDIISPVEPERKWFCMADYHVFSSDNLVDWMDHGMILSQENVPWGKPDGYSMWAPDCVEKNGKYYLYFPDAPKEGRGFMVGVAIADKPEGPYVPQATPIKGAMGIDPCVLQTSKGEAYLVWSGMGLRMDKLSDDMLSLVGESVRLDESFPKGFKEGPFAFERDGRYYLTFPWVQDKTETLAYAMSDNPMGPYEFKGLIMEQSPVGCWTNHHSIVEFKGQWYLFYHHNDYSPQFDKNRSARIDKISFNADGTILPVTPTLRGVGNTPANAHIQIDRYSSLCPVGAWIDFLDSTNTFKGWYVSLSRPGTWVTYDRVDFTSPVTKFIVRVRTKGCRLSITGDKDTPIATIEMPAGDGWRELTFPCSDNNISGIQSLRLTNLSGDAALDWISFQ